MSALKTELDVRRATFNDESLLEYFDHEQPTREQVAVALVKCVSSILLEGTTDRGALLALGSLMAEFANDSSIDDLALDEALHFAGVLCKWRSE